MRNILSTALVVLLAFGCSHAQPENEKPQKKEVQQEVSEAEKVIKALLKPLSVRGIKVKSIEPTNEVEIPGFKTFKVDLIDNRNHREIKRYIFINPQEKYLSLIHI